MKFGKKEKERKMILDRSAEELGTLTNQEARKRLEELEKLRVKPEPCPYLETCEEKMLPSVGEILCLDREVGGRKGYGYIKHMAGKHCWSECKFYNERLREEKGVLPRDLQKVLKKKEKRVRERNEET